MDTPTNIFVTQRKKPLSKSLMDLSLLENQSGNTSCSSPNMSMQSLPNTSTVDIDLETEYKNRIEQMNIELESAHSEIERLNLENNLLQKKLEAYTKKIKILKKIGVSDITAENITTPTANKIKSIFNATEHIDPETATKSISDDISLLNNLDLVNRPKRSLKRLSNKNHMGVKISKEYYEQIARVEDSLEECVPISQEIPLNKEINNDSPTNLRRKFKIEQKKNPKIVILGEQQLVGLSTLMINMLKGQWNDIYSITGFIKPYAKSRDILLECGNLSHLNKYDRVILSIGSNDTNPYEIGRQLCIALEKLKSTKVIVVPVVYNSALNVNLLNDHIYSITKLYDNCIFLRKSPFDSEKLNLTNFLSQHVIHEISKIDYDDKYVRNVSKIIKLNAIKQMGEIKQKMYKKGTIPYYFSTKKTNVVKLEIVSNISTDNKLKWDKGKIPYYFKKTKSNQCSYSGTGLNDRQNHDKTFFRS